MTEIILTPVIDKLVQLLIEEAKLFKGARREVRNLKNELELIYSLFKDVDTRREKEGMSARLKTWLKPLKEVAYKIEDVMDEDLLHVAKHHYHRHGIFLNFLQKISHQIKALNLSCNITSQIQNIQTSLRKFKDRGETYGLEPFDQQGFISRGKKNVEQHHDPRWATLFVEESELVGFHTKRDDLMRKLVGGESTHTIISLVGQGGVGKTTLAKTVYDTEEVKARFNFHDWISVSQSYNIEKILKSIAIQICLAALTESVASEMDALPRLISILRQSLETKRYVIVFYDIWDTNFWKVVKLAFPSIDKRSRIIITTKNDEVVVTLFPQVYMSHK